ncbi:MAG: hypothetical protein MUF54_14690 [Polyangiaceae bacterium]|jgi:hypothetical protein|nr:hypothetical protein [Polyangiaceae bacterium]
MSDKAQAMLQSMLDEMAGEFPGFRIVPKHDDRLSHFIDVVLRIVTFGAQNEYLTRYHTVLGNRLYVPGRWASTAPLDRLITLRHERVHLRQRRRFGSALMAFLYLVPFFPLGLAYGRARIEWEAYAETIRATAELYGLSAARAPALRDHVVRQFTSGAYGWMWPFPKTIESWYEGVIRELRDPGCSPEVHANGTQGEA